MDDGKRALTPSVDNAAGASAAIGLIRARGINAIAESQPVE
jgi:hypothetical protein